MKRTSFDEYKKAFQTGKPFSFDEPLTGAHFPLSESPPKGVYSLAEKCRNFINVINFINEQDTDYILKRKGESPGGKNG